MTTNREWLYGLDVADLAAWFDAEHVEPNDGLAPKDGVSDPDGGSNVAYMAQDSREKLEADVLKYYTHTVSTAMWPPSANKHTDMVSVSMDDVLGWLDRQAAITERECESAAWKANYRHAMARADKLQGQVNELTAERGEIAELIGWRGEVDGNSGRPLLVPMVAAMCEGSELAAELREKLSQAIGHASDIIALQDLTAVDMKGETKP